MAVKRNGHREVWNRNRDARFGLFPGGLDHGNSEEKKELRIPFLLSFYFLHMGCYHEIEMWTWYQEEDLRGHHQMGSGSSLRMFH